MKNNCEYIGEGYIILARKLLESRAWQVCNGEQRGMLVYTLFRANFKDNVWWDGSEDVHISKGSFVTGRKVFAKDTNTSEWKVRNFWKKMKTIGFLTIKPTNQFSIITVCNYERYQSINNYIHPSKPPTDHQQTATNKECKESNNIVRNEFRPYIQEIIRVYKDMKGYNAQPDWAKHHYRRHTKPAGQLYKVAGDKWRDAMKWVAKQGYADWTIETVIKKFPDYQKASKKKPPGAGGRML